MACVCERGNESVRAECENGEVYMRNSTLVESKNKVQFQQCGTSIHAFFLAISKNSMYNSSIPLLVLRTSFGRVLQIHLRYHYYCYYHSWRMLGKLGLMVVLVIDMAALAIRLY
jgi:hypothetical protein